MAYSHRDANYVMNVHSRWETAAEDADGRSWARDLFDATKRSRTLEEAYALLATVPHAAPAGPSAVRSRIDA